MVKSAKERVENRRAITTKKLKASRRASENMTCCQISRKNSKFGENYQNNLKQFLSGTEINPVVTFGFPRGFLSVAMSGTIII